MIEDDDCSSPWKVLGLEEDVYERKLIKRAYAREIKKYKPQTHPEEFRLCRDAYEEIQEIIKVGPHNAEENALNPMDLSLFTDEVIEHNNIRAVDAHQEFREKKSLEQHLQENKNENKNEDELEEDLLRKKSLPAVGLRPNQVIPISNVEFLRSDISVEHWQRIVLFESDYDGEVLAQNIDNPVMFKELDADYSEVTDLVLSARIENEDYRELRTFALQWLDVIEQTAYLNAGYFTMSLAAELAIVDYELAQQIFEIGHEYIRISDREDYSVRHVEMMLQIGVEVSECPRALRKYFARVVRASSWNGFSESDESKSAVRYLSRMHSESMLVYVIQMNIPDMKMTCDRYLRSANKRRRLKGEKSAKIEWKYGLFGTVVLFSIFANMLRGCAEDHKIIGGELSERDRLEIMQVIYDDRFTIVEDVEQSVEVDVNEVDVNDVKREDDTMGSEHTYIYKMVDGRLVVTREKIEGPLEEGRVDAHEASE